MPRTVNEKLGYTLFDKTRLVYNPRLKFWAQAFDFPCQIVYIQAWLIRKSQSQAWLELVTSLKIMFELELVGKSKSLRLAWLGLINQSNQTQA